MRVDLPDDLRVAHQERCGPRVFLDRFQILWLVHQGRVDDQRGNGYANFAGTGNGAAAAVMS